MSDIYLFDVDGTLTVAKQKIESTTAAIFILYPKIIINGAIISSIITGVNRKPGTPKPSIQSTVLSK